MYNRSIPESRDLYDFETGQLPKEGKQARVIVMFPSRQVKHWSVIVETWDHRLFGKGKRLYNQEFTEEERKTITQYHAKIYKWYLVWGYPDYVSMSFKTFELINRAANFFSQL